MDVSLIRYKDLIRIEQETVFAKKIRKEIKELINLRNELKETISDFETFCDLEIKNEYDYFTIPDLCNFKKNLEEYFDLINGLFYKIKLKTEDLALTLNFIKFLNDYNSLEPTVEYLYKNFGSSFLLKVEELSNDNRR